MWTLACVNGIVVILQAQGSRVMLSSVYASSLAVDALIAPSSAGARKRAPCSHSLQHPASYSIAKLLSAV